MAAQVNTMSMLDMILDATKKTFRYWLEFLKFLILPMAGTVLGVLIALGPAMMSILLTATNPGAALVFIFGGAIIGLPLFCWAFWILIVRQAACYKAAEILVVQNKMGDLKFIEKSILKRQGAYIKFLAWLILFGVPVLAIAVYILLQIYPTIAQIVSSVQVTNPDAFINLLGSVSLSFLFLALAFLAYSVIMFLVYPSFVLNPKQKPFDTIVASINLVLANFWSTVGFFLLTAVAFFILSALVQTVSSLLSVTIIAPIIIAFVWNALSMVLNALFQTYWYLHLVSKNKNSI